MNIAGFFKILGYFTSIVLFIFGLVILTGVFDIFRLRYLPDQFRIIFGIVFLLYGMYRFVRLKFIRKERDKADEEDL
jgi:uncharacterized membrane protein YdcZ (DUF606 family)